MFNLVKPGSVFFAAGIHPTQRRTVFMLMKALKSFLNDLLLDRYEADRTGMDNKAYISHEELRKEAEKVLSKYNRTRFSKGRAPAIDYDAIERAIDFLLREVDKKGDWVVFVDNSKGNRQYVFEENKEND